MDISYHTIAYHIINILFFYIYFCVLKKNVIKVGFDVV